MGPDVVTIGIVPVPEFETIFGEETIEAPFVFVTLTVYDPASDVVIDCVVSPPGDHKKAVPEFAVSVTLPPGQKVSGPLAVIDAVAIIV